MTFPFRFKVPVMTFQSCDNNTSSLVRRYTWKSWDRTCQVSHNMANGPWTMLEKDLRKIMGSKQQNKRPEMRHPGQQRDRFFQPSHLHQHHQNGSSCGTYFKDVEICSKDCNSWNEPLPSAYLYFNCRGQKLQFKNHNQIGQQLSAVP